MTATVSDLGSKMRYPYADVIPFRRPAPPHKPSQE